MMDDNLRRLLDGLMSAGHGVTVEGEWALVQPLKCEYSFGLQYDDPWIHIVGTVRGCCAMTRTRSCPCQKAS